MTHYPPSSKTDMNIADRPLCLLTVSAAQSCCYGIFLTRSILMNLRTTFRHRPSMKMFVPVVDRYASHVIFLMYFALNHTVHVTLHVSRRATHCVCSVYSFHLHVIHDVCLIVCSSAICLSLVLAIRPALHLQYQQRRDN